MRRIPLTQGCWTIVDDDDYERLSAHKWHLDRRCGRENTLYAKRQMTIASKSNKTLRSWQRAQLMHRVIMNAGPGQFVDHINGNGLDNRKCNLRLCTNAENLHNQGPRRNKQSSRYKGVCRRRRSGRYEVNIRCGDRSYWVGSFTDEVEAARAYNARAIEVFGEFAWLNPV